MTLQAEITAIIEAIAEGHSKYWNGSNMFGVLNTGAVVGDIMAAVVDNDDDVLDCLGKGTLTGLEELKREYRPKFKADAPKVKQINRLCGRLRCSTVFKRGALRYSGGNLRMSSQRCTRKICPRERVAALCEKYCEFLEKIRDFRHCDEADSRQFWQSQVDVWQERIRKLKGVSNE